ncbi:hypothetical protein J2T57_001490 [Natronocella acetinitrilica]|uniref:Uncharacterized protein n=1 Tax=Natronocella acetinitrilica TaxID=414046 RepID=A0AAE3KC14_9GAMM|nr:hypothetical protein [Natronocella acetinitrilica]MCP1674388.1 hypothetical protein [Natronocella acetinitrilica]
MAMNWKRAGRGVEVLEGLPEHIRIDLRSDVNGNAVSRLINRKSSLPREPQREVRGTLHSVRRTAECWTENLPA